MSKKTLDEVAYVIDSLHQTPQYQEHGFPMVRIVDINNDFLDLRNCLSVSKEVFLEHNKNHIPQKGDIIITRVGSFGMLGYVNTDEPFCLGQNIAIISPKKNGLFLYYYLKSPYIQNIIHGNSGGSSYKCISLEEIKKLPFCDEGLNSKKIGDLLFLLDSKINCNRKICDELESMAKTLYDYWFTQFDFPDKNGKPYRTSGGAMEWNEQLKRKIPKGWKRGCLSDIANIVMGQSPAGETYNEVGNGMVFYQGSTDFGTRFPTQRVYTTAPTRFVKQGDILMSVRAPVGTLNVAAEDCCIGRGLAALNSKLGSQLHLMYTLVGFQQIFNVMDGNGTTFGSITKGDLYNMVVVIPNRTQIEAFEKIVAPIEAKIRIVEQENRELTRLRDWLLPMLMNGQATVLDVEPNARVIAFQNPKPEQYEVRQAARSFGKETTDDTSDLVKEFIKRRNHDAKPQE